MDVPIPDNKPAALTRLGLLFAAAGEHRVLPTIHPSREDAQRLSGDDHLELKGVGHFPTPRFLQFNERVSAISSFFLVDGRALARSHGTCPAGCRGSSSPRSIPLA